MDLVLSSSLLPISFYYTKMMYGVLWTQLTPSAGWRRISLGHVKNNFKHPRKFYFISSSLYTKESRKLFNIQAVLRYIEPFRPSLTGEVLFFNCENGFTPFCFLHCQAPLICTRPENVFTAAWLICDYYQFRVHEGELQPSIPTG